jgi:hypothetical protein
VVVLLLVVVAATIVIFSQPQDRGSKVGHPLTVTVSVPSSVEALGPGDRTFSVHFYGAFYPPPCGGDNPARVVARETRQAVSVQVFVESFIGPSACPTMIEPNNGTHPSVTLAMPPVGSIVNGPAPPILTVRLRRPLGARLIVPGPLSPS